MASTAPYYARWEKLAATLESALCQAQALGSVTRVDANRDPSIEQFGGHEEEDLVHLFNDIVRALNPDSDNVFERWPPYRMGDLTRFKVRRGGKARAARGDLAAAVRKLTR